MATAAAFSWPDHLAALHLLLVIHIHCMDFYLSSKLRHFGVLWGQRLNPHLNRNPLSDAMKRHRRRSLTSYGQLAVQLRVHVCVPPTAPHLVHRLPHHSNGQHKTLRGKNKALILLKPRHHIWEWMVGWGCYLPEGPSMCTNILFSVMVQIGSRPPPGSRGWGRTWTVDRGPEKTKRWKELENDQKHAELDAPVLLKDGLQSSKVTLWVMRVMLGAWRPVTDSHRCWDQCLMLWS